MWLPLLLLTCFFSTASAAEDAAWWNPAWPFRVKIDCPAGEGDVACATVFLADRTTDTGRDLRLTDDKGQPIPFRILHHDPRLKTLLAFRVPPDQAASVWLYFGNLRAPHVETDQLPGMSAARAQDLRAQWRKADQQRQAGRAQQNGLEARIARLRQDAQALRQSPQMPPAASAEADRTIQQLERQLDTLKTQIAELPVAPQLVDAEDLLKWPMRRGVLLSTYRKPSDTAPKTLLNLKKLIAQSTLEGAGFRKGISDGGNPFGPSEHYISVYSGYLKIDQPGEYAFCSASHNGSWVFVNDRLILDWPGPHDWKGAGRGQKNNKVILQPGVVRIEYYHEQTTGQALAFLGWKPPEQDHFTAIPASQWLAVRQAAAAGYEARNRPVIAVPDVSVVNTWWVRDSDEQQAALVQCEDKSISREGKIRTRHWSFGDGLEAWSAKAQHVYFRAYRPVIELAVTDTRGNTDTVHFSPNIFKVDVQSIEFAYGNQKQYVNHASRYEPARMERDDLEAYADFWAHLEQWEQLAKAAAAYLERYGDAPAASRLASLAAKACLSPQQYDPRQADVLLARAIAGVADAQSRHDLLLRRARVLAWDLGDTVAAERIYNEICPADQLDGDALPKEVRRACLLGLGDIALLSGEHDKAEDYYRLARPLAPRTPTEAEELAKEGVYPYSVEDFLERNEYDWARRTLDEWEDQLPESKLDGYTTFLRGKVLFVEHPGAQALRYLSLAEQIAPKGIFVPEAVWLHANCLMMMGRYPQARVELQRIRSDFTRSEFYAHAAEKIKECESKITTTAPATRPRGLPLESVQEQLPR